MNAKLSPAAAARARAWKRAYSYAEELLQANNERMRDAIAEAWLDGYLTKKFSRKRKP